MAGGCTRPRKIELLTYARENGAKPVKSFMQVKAKAAATVCWCKYASEYAASVGSKPWKYILVPHDEVVESKRLLEFLRFEQKA
jgi:type III restriction enzyme